MADHDGSLAGVWRELEELSERLGRLERSCADNFPRLEALVTADEQVKLRQKWELERKTEQRAERALYLTTAQKLGALTIALIGVLNVIEGFTHHL